MIDNQILTSELRFLRISTSWWILFIGVRQFITLTMALITQALVIDYIALGSRFSLRWLGPIITLTLVQSKGWPFISIFWGTYNFILLSGLSPSFQYLCTRVLFLVTFSTSCLCRHFTGDERYVRHWFYWQDVIGLFNEDNPGGNVINSETNMTLLSLMVVIGVLVSVKRMLVGLFLGRKTFGEFMGSHWTCQIFQLAPLTPVCLVASQHIMEPSSRQVNATRLL